MSRVYFTDRTLGKQSPAILSATGLRVERHIDLFPPNGSDEQWLEYCGTNDRTAITHDHKIRYRINEPDAVMRYSVALLVVIGGASYPELLYEWSSHSASGIPLAAIFASATIFS